MIQFHEDRFIYDAQRRGFFLDEPDTLLGDRITRLDVTKYRLSEGWHPVTTVKLDDNNDALGVIDVWTLVVDTFPGTVRDTNRLG